jgi:hypothetical protein
MRKVSTGIIAAMPQGLYPANQLLFSARGGPFISLFILRDAQ